ncbi:MAG: hypothetical protein H6716_27900 [Polyangiaceae bacterium]|nr:hypothetical protein [Polyangiaceae bacterium]
MGWLREMMQRGTQPPRSFGELARRCLAHPSWPADPRPKPRSLATLFSRLDRELDFDWLRDRPAVQQTMAEVLEVPVADIQVHCLVSKGFGAPGEATVRLDDVPFGRALRLKEEPLPPGIPLLPQRVSAWDRVWWVAPSGSGRSLVGRWLEARGAARWVAARDWSAAEPETREPGPVFVELHTAHESESIRRQPPREKICVAADFPPESDEWTVVRCLPLSAYIEDLVGWVAERLPSDSQLRVDTALAWLGGLPQERGVLTTLGAALGLLGLMDEIGHSQIRGRSLNQLARAAIKFRVAKLAGDHRLLKEQGLEILVGIHQQCLTETSLPADVPRSEDEWLRLIPPELARGVDVEWVKLSLQRAGAPVTVRELERAARQLPPGAFRILRALSAGGLLRNLEPGAELSLGPQWLVNIARSAALRQLLGRPALEWGEALLSPGSAISVLDALHVRLEQDPDPIVDGVLELEARDSPAYAAAVECLVRVIGLNPELLREVSLELLRGLYEEQAELAIEVPNGPPLPRLEHPKSLVDDAPTLARGAWYVAIWAIAERLGSKPRSVSHWLDPWRPHDGTSLAPALDAVQAWLRASNNGPGEEMLLRLFDRRGGSPDAPHDLEQASLCLAAFRANTLKAEHLAPWKPELFDRVLRALETPEARSRFINHAAQGWAEQGYPEAGRAWFEAGALPAARIWPSLERDSLLGLVTGRGLRVPWELLSPEHWRWIAELWQLNAPSEIDAESVPTDTSLRQGQAITDQERMLRHIPGETIAGLLSLGASTAPWPAEVLTRAWGAARDRCLKSLEQHLSSATRGERENRLAELREALRLLSTEPAESDPEALEALLDQLRVLEQDATQLADVVRFLQQRVARRGAAWRFAYELLDGVEARRQRLARHAPPV